ASSIRSNTFIAHLFSFLQGEPHMNFCTLKRWIYLAVIVSAAVVGSWALTGSRASAQNAQGLAAVGALDPANGYPRWYMDRTGLQLGQCLDTTSPADPSVMGVVAGSPAPPAIPNPGAPLSFPDNFPDEFFYWRTTAGIANIGGLGGRAVLVMSTQAGFGGATGT